MNTTKTFIFDFDSTFIQVEALDELSVIVHGKTNAAQKILSAIQEITNLGMEGKITLKESLFKRIQLLQAHRDHLEELIKELKGKISTSVIRNKNFFKLHKEEVYIISNGFKEIIVPIVQEFGIKPQNVLANTFEFDHQGKIVGFDQKDELCENKGKALKIQSLNFEGEVIMIGDGYTDYETLQYGVVSKFYAFTENVRRQVVLDLAEKIAPSLDEILYDLSYKASVSYPKNRIQVLLLENIHPDAVAQFEKEGYQVTSLKGSLSEEELSEQIKDVSILGIRSKTIVTEQVLKNANKLHAIGTFCIGTNQVDLQVCSQKGIAVFNAPYSNTRSVVELAIGEMIMLMRATFEKSQKMHQGIWDKSANGSVEIRGKKLGIVGYGSIGSQLSILAEALGMQVYFYDVVDKLALGNARKCASLQELLAIADVISLHVDGRENNQQLIAANEFNLMKNGVVFLNLSRGHIVDMDALITNLDNGKIKGTAIDVFPYEPKNNDEIFVSALRGRHNVILTPHIGGSTEEAQHDIGHYVSGKIIQYINTGTTFGSVNLPEIQLPEFDNAHRVMHIHENVKGILAQINTILSNANCNILGQYLKTNEQIGYVITDIDSFYDPDLEKQLKMIPNTIRYRILY
ncbi:phosphoglycerate dehydrogenase [Flavobacterium oreochromis]|uniref:D-3-phosphoglycerate dehydrogenase n=1 Tax=Flavobacterium oreochromis TaxID=2906078 RepID=A0ABW8P7X0_9FLAO|nr:phosphoglycerate dehydrogenase [Flavobacterium oreochromis]OWP74892.1 3-phosphoglycerate dehydrogenase [Flavobacterium oreochromis]